MKCVHRYRFEEPNGPTSLGVCRYCGDEKRLPNYDVRDAGGWQDITGPALGAEHGKRGGKGGTIGPRPSIAGAPYMAASRKVAGEMSKRRAAMSSDVPCVEDGCERKRDGSHSLCAMHRTRRRRAQRRGAGMEVAS